MRMLVMILIVVIPRGVLLAGDLPPAAEQTVDFARDIRPLLAKQCWACHGQQKQESGLRLDQRDALLAGGDLGKVVVVGKSAESRLVHYIAGTDPDSVMPPKGERLSAEAVGLLRAWIDQGLDWPADSNIAVQKNLHWAYQPLRPVSPPEVRRADWPRNAIDQFVLAELERRELLPAPEADRITLIRRLYLDLLGFLPPVTEVEAFVADTRPDAYARLVDRLLASPHFGERWGRHWLDMARYADSDGYEKDNARPDAYLYRDWVIAAINADLPYDQFTIEQIAGDLLPNATLAQRLATAFHRQTLTNTEGGVDQEQFRVEACFDRTETTGAVWLGLTVGCARCHTHKFDAITQREYYQLFAFFNNSDEQTTAVPLSAEAAARFVSVQREHEKKLAAATKQWQAAQAASELDYQDWLKTTRADLVDAKAQAARLHDLEDLQATSDGKATLTKLPDSSVLATGENPSHAVYTVVARTSISEITALRLEVLPDKALPAQGPGRVAHGNFVLSELTLEASEAADFSAARKIEFKSARADFEQEGQKWPAMAAIDGQTETGWAIAPQFGKPHWLAVRLKEPLSPSHADKPIYLRMTLTQQYGSQHTIGRFKLAIQTGADADVSLPADISRLIVIPEERRSASEKQHLRDHFHGIHPSTKKAEARLRQLEKQSPRPPELAARVLAQRTANLRTTHVLKRGEFLDPVKDIEVQPAAMATLPPLESRSPGAPADRLDLARWLVSPEQPLTPRVTVNQVWRHLFGNGLVRTLSDFGVQGERPTHPALLDWLALEFTSGRGAKSPASGLGWSRKKLIKLLVMSATYRQSSHYRADLAELDPQTIWLARQNRWRVEAEVLRDISLDAAGLLSRKIGGPSVFPALPPGIAELSYAGNFKWTESAGEDRYRRGMYTFFKRTSPHPNLTTFDCPDANLTTIERKTSNTPLQALTTLNNASFAESAQALSRWVVELPQVEDRERLARAFQRCVARQPTESETQALAQLLTDARAWYGGRPDEAKALVGAHLATGAAIFEQAAWIATLRILLNLDEFVTRE